LGLDISLADGLMPSEILRLNLEALAKRYPRLAERLEELPPSDNVRVETAQSGEPTLLRRLPDGSEKILHSRREPRRESARWAQAFKVKPSETVALFGIGLGYPVEEFLRAHHKQVGALWCVESSLEVFRALLANKDWRLFLEEPLVHFFVGVGEDEFRVGLHSHFQKAMVDGVEVVEYPSLVSADPEWYRARQSNLRDMIRQWTAEMMLVFSRGRLFIRNIQENFRDLIDRDTYLLRDIGEVFRGRPAILVSAGPSLDGNASQLAEAKGKIPIVAVDTALRILNRHGVQADFAMSIDSLGMSTKHFEGVPDLENIPLLYDLEVTPGVAADYPGRRYLVGNSKPHLYRWIEEITGPLEGLTKGLTVAQAAFAVLAKYGADPIILVGQDLSFQREGGRTHAEGAAFQGRYQPGDAGSGKWEDPLDPQGLLDIAVLEVPANDGGVVPTTHALYSYLRRLEEDIATSGARVINCTEGGAFIRGTRVIPLRQAYTDLGLRDLPPFGNNLEPPRTLAERHGEELAQMRGEMVSRLEKILASAEEGFKTSDKIWRDLGWKTLSENEIYKKLDEARKPLIAIKDNKKNLMLIDQGVQRSLYMLHKGDLPDPADRTNEDYRVIAERYRSFYAEAIDTAQEGLAILNRTERENIS
jgi:hypothetical protein